MTTLQPASAAARTDLLTLTSRIARLAPDGLVRLKGDGERVTAWALVVGVLVRRDLNATLEGATDITVSGKSLSEAVEASVTTSDRVPLPSSMDASWRASSRASCCCGSSAGCWRW